MGNKESKRLQENEIKVIPSSCKKYKNQTNGEIFTMEQKQDYEDRYKILESNYIKLQQQFIAMKAKFDQNIAETGDFTTHAIELNNRLEEALKEREIQNNNNSNDCNLSDYDDDSNKELQRFSDATGDGFTNITENAYKEKIENLQKELDKLLSDDAYKKQEISELQAQLEEFQLKAAQEKKSIVEEFNCKGLLLREKYEEETKQLIKLWEQKLMETIGECHNEITFFKNQHNKEKLEKFDLKERLENTESQLAALEKKHKLLSNMYEDIRQRYDSRESRLEDLEKIADLEGQLIVHAEELEKQKDLIKSMKNSKENGNTNAPGTGRRSKKNAKKHRKAISNNC